MAQNRPDWMRAEALQLLDQAERAHRDLFRPSAQRRRTACWEPPVDVFETDGELWIQVALPGVGPDQVEVRIEDGALVVAGERTLPTPRGAGVIRRLEMRMAASSAGSGWRPGATSWSGASWRKAA